MHTFSFLLSLIPKVKKWKQGLKVVLQWMASMFSLYDHIILQANASSPALHHSILHCFQSPKYYSFNTGKLRQENLCSFEARQVYIENLVSKTKQTKDARNFLRHTGRGALCQGTAYRRQHGKIIPQNT